MSKTMSASTQDAGAGAHGNATVTSAPAQRDKRCWRLSRGVRSTVESKPASTVRRVMSQTSQNGELED